MGEGELGGERKLLMLRGVGWIGDVCSDLNGTDGNSLSVGHALYLKTFHH